MEAAFTPALVALDATFFARDGGGEEAAALVLLADRDIFPAADDQPGKRPPRPAPGEARDEGREEEGPLTGGRDEIPGTWLGPGVPGVEKGDVERGDVERGDDWSAPLGEVSGLASGVGLAGEEGGLFFEEAGFFGAGSLSGAPGALPGVGGADFGDDHVGRALGA